MLYTHSMLIGDRVRLVIDNSPAVSMWLIVAPVYVELSVFLFVIESPKTVKEPVLKIPLINYTTLVV